MMENDGMMGNAAGCFHLPLGITKNFLINGIEYLFPTAVEKPSVVAAPSHMAKLSRETGGFNARVDRPVVRANPSKGS